MKIKYLKQRAKKRKTPTGDKKIKEIILVGGGHANLTVISRKKMGRFKNARVTLINPQVEQLYSSMVPGLITKRFNYDESSIDLMQLTQFSDCRFYKDTLISVNPKQKFIECKKKRAYRFRHLKSKHGFSYKKNS